MAGIARPFIPWIGSKEKLIPYIWQVFPPNPKLYLEPFGGGGALLLGMQPKVSRMDIYNDFNCDLVNLFLCARECTVQLVRELKFIPFHSRAEFDLLKEFMKHKELLQQRIADERNAVMECFSGEEREELLEILRERSCLFDVQRAAAYYKVCRGSFSGTTTSFGVKPNNLTNFLYLFDDASKRLQDVVIENKDCLDIIRERDGPDSLIYCDPPYFDAESLYAVDFPKEKHEELHHILSQCKGYIVVSYNDCPFIRGLYGDFFILAFRRNNPLSQKAGATYGELIITNYDPRPYIQPQFSRTVYMYLRDRAGGGNCWPGIKTIARDLRLSRRTVQRALNDLERAGYIQRQRRHRENGSCTSNLYISGKFVLFVSLMHSRANSVQKIPR